MSDRATVYNIPSGEPFLDVLARGMLDANAVTPHQIADTRVLLPTRRACRALRDAFLRVADGDALILPRMQALGDVDDEDNGALGAAGATIQGLATPTTVPAAIEPVHRKLLLTRLVLKFDRERRAATASSTSPIEPGQAADLADDLASLLDQVQTEQQNLENIGSLAPAELAVHWQETLDFLAIITDHWPQILAEAHLIDHADRRNRTFDELAAAWQRDPPEIEIIAAGSTGSIPATAELLGVIARLPRGAVILPGLDMALDTASWDALGATHPQLGVKQLLARIGVAREEVKMWPSVGSANQPHRAQLMRDAMRPAELPIAWEDAPRLNEAAFAGLRWLDHPTPQDEAKTIAVLMRQTLQQSERTAALITPDRALARRVAAELQRWGIDVDDSAGTPLRDTPVGTFLRLSAELAGSGIVPIALLALLKHPLAAGGITPEEFRYRARRLELAILRGPRPASGFGGLAAALNATATEEPQRESLSVWLNEMAKQAAPFMTRMADSEASLGDLLAAHIGFAEWLASRDNQRGSERLWRGDSGEAAALLIEEIRAASGALPEIAGAAYPGLLDSLMRGRVVRPAWGRHPRLSILGTLEARLQFSDLVILGGLNEGTWPPDPMPDPWLSRPMRAALGLSSPERRIGQSAHDFVQAAAVPHVVLSRATKVGGTPTVPARWLLRLATLATRSGVGWGPTMRSAEQQWAARLDEPHRVEPRPAPAATPPLVARPRKMSVTRVEAWIRDPYAVYAREILRLRRLDVVDATPNAANRGIVIHAVLDRFIAAYPDVLPDDALQRLLAIGHEEFAHARIRPGVAAFWWPRFIRIARWFVDNETKRRRSNQPLGSEIRGELSLQLDGGGFTVTAIADRIDRRDDGELTIIDYKTGQIPSPKQVHGGWSPQLPLEAMIAAAGGFDGIDADAVRELSYWRLTGADPAGEERPISDSVDDLVDATGARLRALVAAFDRVETPYHSRPRPNPTIAPKYSDYDHLARVAEWSEFAPEDSW